MSADVHSRLRVVPADPAIVTRKRLSRGVRKCVADFRRRVRRCRDSGDARAIHELRVQSRRLVVWCELLESLGGGRRAREARRRVKKLLRSLARLRDLHVQREWLSRAPRSISDPARSFRRQLREEEPRRARRVAERCRRMHPGRILDLLEGVLGSGRLPSDGVALSKGIQHWLDSLEGRAWERQAAIRARDPQTLHRFRIAVKHLRYGLEIASVLGWETPDRAVDSLRDLQGRLGDIQDFDVCHRRLDSWSRDPGRSRVSWEPLRRWLLRERDRRVRAFLKRRSHGIPGAGAVRVADVDIAPAGCPG
ncbi:MAG: CHAD domain-containing protein [Verrucomicrobiales bacterium]|nr:CHAD domain-containing protein [Verrucomicrobiales bacterium]